MIKSKTHKKRLVLTYEIVAGDYIKVGKSRDTKERLGAVQTGCPFKAKILFVTTTPEKRLHRLLRPYRADGGSEWFRFNDDVLDILSGLVWARTHNWHFAWGDTKSDSWELVVCDNSQVYEMDGCVSGKRFKWKTADGDRLVMNCRPDTYSGYLCSCFNGALNIVTPDGISSRPRPTLLHKTA